MRPIDVVIPVYRGFGETRRCIESVLASPQAAPTRVVAIDDATPEPAIAAWLDDVARSGRLTLLRNEANLGFVRSVNRGMALDAGHDVVLLNSDTEVANDWLDRLRASAYRDANIATVTPFSNNATICSYPFEGWEGRVPGTLGLARLDALFARTNAGRAIDIPTAVGFCMFIRRDCLERLGAFDAERFGRGYGEENDFCMRAAKAGWRNVLAADVFVFHEGAVSFSEERAALTQAAGHALIAIHPEYPAKVHAFVRSDPAAELRSAIDVARVESGTEEAKHVIAERLDERTRLVAGLWEIDKLAEAVRERQTVIGQLDRALEHASELVAERDRLIAEERDLFASRAEEDAKLRAGLAHAEKLAFERADELERIHSFWLWRCVSYLKRRGLQASRKARGAS